MSFERLIAEHSHIDRVAAELIAIVDGPPDVDAAAPVLAELAFKLHEHLAYEDRFVYPRLLSSDSGVSEDARAFITELGLLSQNWEQYLKDWTADCIAADWTTFGAETRAIIRRLQDRVSRENSFLYPQALQQGCIKLRDLRKSRAA